jgi:histidine kinase
MAAQLEQMEATRRELIGDVAHELRTPLASIKGSMEGLIDGVLPAEAPTFQQIYREADRLQHLVADLQELSRVEAGAFELNLRRVAVADLVQATLARLGRQFEEKGVALESDIPAGLPPVRADEDRAGQVLLNLVGNALQYTPAGGRVWVSARRQGTEVHIQVSDTGIGIPPEHLPLVFTRFYRVDKSRARAGGGSGIGLTIARHLVEAHGGRIWAESPGPGQGSTFTFTLPQFTPTSLPNL